MTALVDNALSWLTGLWGRRAGSPPETDSVRAIAAELGEIPPARARYLAAFAYVLSRAARADDPITDTETRKMVSLLLALGHLSYEQATRLVEAASAHSGAFGGTEDFLVTRELRSITTHEQRLEVLECLFVVAASDDGISSVEEAQIRQIASELGFAHHHYVAVRMSWSHERNVLKPLRGSAVPLREVPPPGDIARER